VKETALTDLRQVCGNVAGNPAKGIEAEMDICGSVTYLTFILCMATLIEKFEKKQTCSTTNSLANSKPKRVNLIG